MRQRWRINKIIPNELKWVHNAYIMKKEGGEITAKDKVLITLVMNAIEENNGMFTEVQ